MFGAVPDAMLKQIQLVGEQKRILFLPVQNPIQIKGVAGSGKTTVAMYRAKHLQDTQSNLFEPSKVVLFTFNKTLSKYIQTLLPVIQGGYSRDSDVRDRSVRDGMGMEVVNFHSWAFQFLRGKNRMVYGDTVMGPSQESVVEDAMRAQPDYGQGILAKSSDFFLEEISWMKGQMFRTAAQYNQAKRTGRGSGDRVTQKDKVVIWRVFEKYNSLLNSQGKFDYDDYALMLLEEIEKPGFTPKYTHIVVDEAQDLSKAQMLAISKLVKPETSSITIIADAAQRIYKSGFTWSDVGINVVGGRTKELKKNYRNTYEIFDAATSLIAHDPDGSEFTEPIYPSGHGDKPVLCIRGSWEAQMNEVLKVLKASRSTSTVVLTRNFRALRSIQYWLRDEGLDVELILGNGKAALQSDAIKLCTLSSIKGLEFERVLICDVNEGVLPNDMMASGEEDELNVSTERRLLYTAMTRAEKELYLFSSSRQSPFIAEMNAALFQTR